MSEIRYYERLRSADWRKHPSKVAFWLTLWLVGATRVVTEAATSAPGWWPCGGHRSMGSLIRCEECATRADARDDLSDATSPAVVLELLDRLAAAEGAVARVRSVRALIQMWADEAEKRGPADQINTAGVVAMLAHAIKEQP